MGDQRDRFQGTNITDDYSVQRATANNVLNGIHKSLPLPLPLSKLTVLTHHGTGNVDNDAEQN